MKPTWRCHCGCGTPITQKPGLGRVRLYYGNHRQKVYYREAKAKRLEGGNLPQRRYMVTRAILEGLGKKVDQREVPGRLYYVACPMPMEARA